MLMLNFFKSKIYLIFSIMSFGIFLFEKVGYCCEEVDCVCGTTQFAGANYVATVILS